MSSRQRAHAGRRNKTRRIWPAAWLCVALLAPACSRPGLDESGRREPASSTPASEEGKRPLPPLVLSPETAAPPAAVQAAPRPQPARRPPRQAGPSVPSHGGPPPPVPPSPPAAGTFLYTETGITRIRGCLTLDQPPPSPTKLIAGAASGGRQHIDRDERDALGSGSITSADLEYRPDGIYLAVLKQTQTSLLSSQPVEFRPSPPVLLLPAGATAGQDWSFTLTSTDGGVKIDSQNRVESVDEPVTTASGQTVAARRVVADSKITGGSTQGTLDLSRKMTTWYAPQNGLPAKEVVDLKGRVGLCELDSHIESTIQSI